MRSIFVWLCLALPGVAEAFLSGQTLYGMGVQVIAISTGIYAATAIRSITFQ